MFNSWFRYAGYAGACIRRWYRPQLLGSSPIQGGFGEAESDEAVAAFFPDPASGGIRRTKLWVCGLSLVATYTGWFLGKDPSQLQIIVPSIIAAYCAAQAYTDGVIRKFPNGSDRNSSPDDGR